MMACYFLIYIDKITGLSMPRAKLWGYIASISSALLGCLFFYPVFIADRGVENCLADKAMAGMNNMAYAAIAIPIGAAALFIIGTGFWIGFTILTIKVVPPMPELTDKKDYSKIKAFFLCLITLGLGALFLYGICTKNFWSLAIPAALISLVILGAIFWVGIAIITTRSTLPEMK
jgi:hypothetical protein